MDSCSYTFATFNCKNIKRSVDSIRDLCNSCDLIALQETWLLPEDLPYLGTINSGFTYTGKSAVDTSAGILRGRPHGGVAILWKSSVFQQVSVLKCDKNRICAIKIITKDRPVIVMSVYMPTNSMINLPEFTDCLSTMRAIVDEYGIESVFMLGDYNADINELFYRELFSFCNEQLWSCIDVDMLGADSGTYTFISDAHGTCSWLDHCLITQAAKRTVINISVKYDTLWSDHFPLILECNLNILSTKVLLTNSKVCNNKIIWGERSKEQVTNYTKECHMRLKKIDFPMEFVNCADSFCSNPCHRQVLDGLYSDIVAALGDASLASRGNTGGGRRGPRIAGWNEHVSDAHRNARIKFTEWVLCGKPRSGIVYDAMYNSRKVFKSRLKWCQDHQDQLKMDALAEKYASGDFKSFWRSTKKLNLRPGVPVSIDGVSDHKRIADVFRQHFSVQPALRTVGEVFNVENLTGSVGSTIKTREIAAIIKNMTRGKSPGHDGLSIEHLQHAGPHISRVLSLFYSMCVSHSYLPADMLRTVVVPIVKNKTGDLAEKSNYRPISLATIVAKVFDGVLNLQLQRHVTNLNHNQFGFRPKLSTESAILCLKHTVRYYTDRKTPVFACFLDLSKAFDLVAYDVLWEKLKRNNLPQELINIFKYWYGHQVNSVKWAGAVSEPYRLECGVRQGGLTSPTLFNIYMDALIGELSSMHVGCHIDDICVNNISYADDMVLLSASICGLRELMRVCEEYVLGHGLRYNASKSQLMVFETGGAKCPQNIPPVWLNNVPLDRVYQFKYLGHMLTADLKDNVDIERERRALSVRANMLARRFARSSDGVKIMLFRAYCTSLYTCALWADYTQRAYGSLRVQYNNAMRAMLGLPRYCSASGMFAAARTDCFFATMRKRCASLVRRVRASSNTILAMIGDRADCHFIRHCCNKHL